MDLATAVALKSPSRFRLGAVLVKRRKVLGVGFNNMAKTHPRMERFNNQTFTLGLHAEVAACVGIPLIDLEGADLYVVRLLKNGKRALAKPCYICQKFIAHVGIRGVYYSE